MDDGLFPRLRMFREGIVALAAMGVAPAVFALDFDDLALRCAPEVHPATLRAVVSVESAFNRFAIGVVGGSLKRQPKDLPEAVAAARKLEAQGFNFSMGLGQVNRYNLARQGVSYDTVFDPCNNLRAGGAILTDCYQRAMRQTTDEQTGLQFALSCYYSGNFKRGFVPDKSGAKPYVQKVVESAGKSAPIVPAIMVGTTETAAPKRKSGIIFVEAETPEERATVPTPQRSGFVVFDE